MAKFIKINPADNVAVCIEAGVQNEEVSIGGVSFKLKQEIPVGHKVSLTAIGNVSNVCINKRKRTSIYIKIVSQ